MENTAIPATAPLAWNAIVRQALVLTIALIAFSALLYVLDINIMKMSTSAVSFIVTIALGVGIALMTIRHQRALDGGFISFGRAFLVGLATVAVGVFLSGFWNYILVKFIDPNYPTRMKEQMMEAWGDVMPPEALEEMETSVTSFERMRELDNIALTSLAAALIFGLICALIAAAIGRRNPATA
ncbi:MAG: DUF4199 domain-containing protein [Saprospiraceae bacterium]|nr:DUF4199 domain-containing protein [Saprospiraceae bacterium]MDW8485055.1 DUF4199 domain-containing protein [Saprospiraceae bacterium]